MTSPLIEPDWPAPPGIRAFSTTRSGGVSTGPWLSFNLGAGSGDSPAAVAENQARLAAVLPSPVSWVSQVHGTRAVKVEDIESGVTQADAVFTSGVGQVCAVLTADCLPVLFTTRQGTAVAAAHAGWRGLAAGVLEQTVAAMDVDPGDLLAWIGPGIGPGAYEVGGEVRRTFIENDADAEQGFRASGTAWMANLPLIARQRLEKAGVSAIYGGKYCTYDDPERFFSYRRDGVTGRMASLIWMQ